jgi:hypothetical protein
MKKLLQKEQQEIRKKGTVSRVCPEKSNIHNAEHELLPQYMMSHAL